MRPVHLCNAWINGEFTACLSPRLNKRGAQSVALILIKIDKERAAISGIAPDFCMGFVALKFRRSESLAQSIDIQPNQTVCAWRRI